MRLEPWIGNLDRHYEVSKSRRSQPTPVQTRQDTIDVDCCVGMIEERVIRDKRRTYFVCPFPSTIGYYWL